MELPPADVIAAANRRPEPEPTALAPVVASLVPLGDAIRNTLAAIALIPVAQATPEERTQLIALREEIARVNRDTSTWLDAIDLSFRHAGQAMGANEIPLANGVVRLEVPRGEWRVDEQAMLHELREYAKNGGALSLEEVDTLFTTTVQTKADNAKLNYLVKHRGDEVAAIIDRHRTMVPGNPLAAKVKVVQRA